QLCQALADRLESAFDVGDDFAQRAAADVVLDDDAARDVLAADDVGRLGDAHVGDVREQHSPAIGRADLQAFQVLNVHAVLLRQPDDHGIGQLLDGDGGD